MEANDMAACREALEAALRFIGNLEIEPYSPLDEDASELRQTIMDVLAKPRRNCDVGTPKEQSVRYEEFCFDHRSRERCCLDCPLLHEPSCELAWAQMAYAGETAPDRDIPLDIDHILAVGRELQASDTWHGATYDTAKLLCDTIEALRGKGEGGFTPRKRVSKIGPADFTADRDASSGTGGGT